MIQQAKIIADSITEDNDRLITYEATCWRPVLAEQNTHCVLSRNSASSRAIPVQKMLDRFDTERTENPIVWPREKKGMQGGSELEGTALEDAKALWDSLTEQVKDAVGSYVESHPDPEDRLHKSLLNRWLEIGLWQTQIISATQWDGYFWQRCHADAEPHIKAMADAMFELKESNTPKFIEPGNFHLPYWAENGGHESDWHDAEELSDHIRSETEIAIRCSTARCARVSYLTQDGSRDIIQDIDLYDRLTGNRIGSDDPPHASPLEHVATPWLANRQSVTMPNGRHMGPLPKLGKFIGWLQLRHIVLEF